MHIDLDIRVLYVRAIHNRSGASWASASRLRTADLPTLLPLWLPPPPLLPSSGDTPRPRGLLLCAVMGGAVDPRACGTLRSWENEKQLQVYWTLLILDFLLLCS